MKKNIIYLAALAMLAAACSEEDNAVQPGDETGGTGEVKMITETITATNGDANGSTRAAVDASAQFTWSAGDQIAVHVSNGNYYTTAALATGGNKSAEFSVSYPEGSSRDAFAVYPASIVTTDAANYGQEDHTLDVTLPGSYKLSELSGETTPCPMIATNTPNNGWEFYQLCGLLRLTVNSIPASTSYLKIDFNGKKVQGAFSVAKPVAPGTSVIATSATTGTDDIITITELGISSWANVVLNIPLPTGEYTNVTVTAYDSSDEAILTATRPFAYTASRKHGTMRTVSFPSSMTAFRGYEVSTGILERSVVGSEATYSLTAGEMVLTADPASGKEIYALPDGCNPFEGATYYKQSTALDKYYNKWFTLRDELGADGNNINATSDKLPAGWQFPSAGNTQHSTGTDWGNILFGAPKSPITVNGVTLTKINYQYYTPFALVAVTLEEGNGYSVAAGTYYGLFLLRDGLTIPEGYFTKIGLDVKYTENPLTEAQFNDLVRMGCLFISASGYYDGSWCDLNETYQEGYYLSNTYYDDKTPFVMFVFDQTGHVSVATRSTGGAGYYCLVKLVKPVKP